MVVNAEVLMMENNSTLYEKLGKCHPALEKGLVRCTTCGNEKKVDSSECLKRGWPVCCGYTMRLIVNGR